MATHKVCDYCDAALDFGEKCNCSQDPALTKKHQERFGSRLHKNTSTRRKKTKEKAH